MVPNETREHRVPFKYENQCYTVFYQPLIFIYWLSWPTLCTACSNGLARTALKEYNSEFRLCVAGTSTVRQQPNSITSYIDAGTVYASSQQHFDELLNLASRKAACLLCALIVGACHRRTRLPPPTGLKIFRANSVFSASASCSKILIDKKYISKTVNSELTLFFRVSASCSKILNVKSRFNTVKNFRTNSVFQGKRKAASCSKTLNLKKYIQYSKNFRANSVFRGKRELLKNLER